MTADAVERESMDFDVVIVGAGPAGLAAAIRIKQLAAEQGHDASPPSCWKGWKSGRTSSPALSWTPRPWTRRF
jgi:electron-transferring-flavoprotein dehydrogenase